jgi:rSAM/selenodomain-associated transferase 2
MSSSPLPTVSVIIPALNEARNLGACLSSLDSSPGDEVWLVDGGSSDDTETVARTHGAGVVPSPIAQRAAQLNLGAARAQGQVLLFLHADTLLPPNGLDVLKSTLAQNPAILGGGFRRRFDHPSRLLRLTSWLAGWRARWWGALLGDQAMFVRRSAFHALGGFPAMDVFEDLEFSLRLRALGRTAVLPATVISSGRRFVPRGAARQTAKDFWLTVQYLRSRQPSSRVPGKPRPAP